MKHLRRIVTDSACRAALVFAAAVSLASALGDSTAATSIAAASSRPFAAFDAKLEIDIEDGEVELTATFALGPGDDKIDPITDAIALHLKGGAGDFSLKLPAGSLQPERNGTFQFRGNIEGVKLLAVIRPLRAGTFELEIVTEGANLRGLANPVTVSLHIGNYGGSRSVRAKIE